jgi:hypothetical protein
MFVSSLDPIQGFSDSIISAGRQFLPTAKKCKTALPENPTSCTYAK